MSIKETDIKYYDGKESHGMIIDWRKVFREYNKLKVPGEYFSPVGAPVDKAKYLMYMSERATGKTTNWLLIGMILNQMYGTVIQYVRATEDQIKPSIADEVFNVILSYENGRYIQQITEGRYNNIYIHWKKAYFCHIDPETGNRDETASEPFMQYLSIDQNFSYKSVYNAPTGDLILFDEFIGKTYRPNEFIDFLDLIATIRRNRITPIIVMLANGINLHSDYFKEMEITREVKGLKPGKNVMVTTKNGTTIYVEAIGVKKTRIKEIGSMLFFGFLNPKVNSIVGGDELFSFENAPHIIKDETDVILDRRLRIDVGTEILMLELCYTNDRGYIVNVHEATTVYKDSVILTLEDIWDRQHIWGIGNSKYLKFIWNLYKANKFYYQNNETASVLNNYIQQYIEKRK